jgi:hypothetical protein
MFISRKLSVLFVGEMSTEMIARIAKMIGAEFSGWKGIYQLEKRKN